MSINIYPTDSCHRCKLICLDSELTVCIHYDTGETLGKLCDDCVEEWLKFVQEEKE